MGPNLARAAAAAKSSAAKARAYITSRQRGYVRKGGYYGRFSRAAGNELKFYDETKSATATTLTGAVLESSMNNIPEGTGQSERLGRKCTVTQIQVRGMVHSEGPLPQRVRFVIAHDKQCNGATATWSGGDGPFEGTTVDSFRNLENSSRFRILYDKTWAFNQTANPGSYIEKNFSAYIKCNLPLEFSGATGGLTEIRSNNLVTFAISEYNTGTGEAAPTIEYHSRLRYKDN